MREETRKVAEALAAQFGAELAYSWNGGLRLAGGPESGREFTLQKARKLTGLAAKPRQQRTKVTAYGDWAWVAALNGVKVEDM